MNNNQIGRRAKTNLPAVLLTLLSIVQALALELMWAHLGEHDYLYSLSFTSILCWLQIATTLLGVLLVWLIYSGLVMRFSWVPNTTDLVFPFVVGIVQFTQIATLGPAMVGQWLLILAVLFAMMIWISQATMTRARLDGDNDDFFSHVGRATRRDLIVMNLPVVGLAVVGIWIWVSGSQGWFALAAIGLAFSLLAVQLWLNHIFMRRSYQPLEWRS